MIRNFVGDPLDIERKSFEIIGEGLAERRKLQGTNARQLTTEEELVLKRVIHTSADFDYDDNLVFTNDAVACGIEILHAGANIVTDTRMALAGINKQTVQKYGGQAVCYMSDDDVAVAAKSAGTTRATAAVDKAARELDNPVFVVGNAPTALIRIVELIEQNKLAPKLIIGVPVGFVNVVESKELLLELDIPCIVARGRKGGSNVAASIVNALIYQDGGRAI
jgi:precorrin-8X/cobalt-precorrin-8 methylmutase